MRRYRLSRKASTDLDEIFDYVATHGSVSTAEKVVDQLMDAVTLLGRNPDLGISRRDLAAEVRSLPVGNWVIYYRRATRRIEIVRILHGSRDQRSALSNTLGSETGG